MNLHRIARQAAMGLAFMVAIPALSGCDQSSGGREGDPASPAETCSREENTRVTIPGGTFTMGSDAVYGEEGPVRTVEVAPFAIDKFEVTNRQFAAFIDATGYVTVAERPVDPAIYDAPVSDIPPHLLKPGSAVFVGPDMAGDGKPGWEYLPGAYWKEPFGPEGKAASPEFPVVHLAVEDMEAYADWAGGRLPTEEEWEYAAAGSGPKEVDQPGPDAANSWQGVFPYLNEGKDGFAGAAPKGCFKPNRFGLHDMIGNVWEVTADGFKAGQSAAPGTRVMKGGSYLCAPNYCMRYRAPARQPRDSSLGASNVGFRLAYDID